MNKIKSNSKFVMLLVLILTAIISILQIVPPDLNKSRTVKAASQGSITVSVKVEESLCTENRAVFGIYLTGTTYESSILKVYYRTRNGTANYSHDFYNPEDYKNVRVPSGQYNDQSIATITYYVYYNDFAYGEKEVAYGDFVNVYRKFFEFEIYKLESNVENTSFTIDSSNNHIKYYLKSPSTIFEIARTIESDGGKSFKKIGNFNTSVVVTIKENGCKGIPDYTEPSCYVKEISLTNTEHKAFHDLGLGVYAAWFDGTFDEPWNYWVSQAGYIWNEIYNHVGPYIGSEMYEEGIGGLSNSHVSYFIAGKGTDDVDDREDKVMFDEFKLKDSDGNHYYHDGAPTFILKNNDNVCWRVYRRKKNFSIVKKLLTTTFKYTML